MGKKRNAKLVLIKILPIGNEWYCQEKKEDILCALRVRETKERKTPTASKSSDIHTYILKV